MNFLENALQKLRASGKPDYELQEADRAVESRELNADDEEKICLLEPLAKVTAKMQAAEGDTMSLAWDLRGNSALFNQFRSIRREIEKQLSTRCGKPRGTVIVVTSAIPGDGKSFISAGLARVLAAGQDRKVVLVDGDLPKRHLTQLFGTGELPGLSECLADGRAISEVLCPCDHPAMTFVPAGKWTSDVPDLITSGRLDRVLKSFRQCDERHVFVIDTAPVLAFGETAYLAERADLVVLTIRADQTPRAAVEEALRKLAADRPLALLLNGQQGSVLDGYYGYGDYGYGAYTPPNTR